MKREGPMKREVKNFTLHVSLDGEDARIVLKALDLFMRVHMGQLDNIGHELSYLYRDGDTRDQADDLLNQVKTVLFPQFPRNASHGIRECPFEPARRAYDILQAIQNKEAWTRLPGGPKEHGPMVFFDSPFQVTQKPLPEVEATVSVLEEMARAAQDPPAPKKRTKKTKR